MEQRLFLILGCCCLCLSACAEELHGRVVRVADGDTITVLAPPVGTCSIVASGGTRPVASAISESHGRDGARSSHPPPSELKIRLHGIDAPESHQAFGQKSKERLALYVSGKDVAVKWKSKDKYERILGTVWLGSTDINLQMLRDGFAWHYKRFDSNPVYAAARTRFSLPASEIAAILADAAAT